MCYSLDMILPLERQLEIDAIIENIAITTGVSYPRNSLTDIVEAVGIKLIIDDLSRIDPNISGAIQYDDEKKTNPVIFINSIHPINRQRFTLAHELGHFFLHNGGKLRIDNLNYADDNKNVREEVEANYFAASLLMPKGAFLQKVKEGYEDIELGSYFGVSVEAARNRRRWLRKKINR